MKKILYILTLISLVFLACKHELPIIEINKVSEFKYTPNSIQLFENQDTTSFLPTYNSVSKASFSLSVNPQTNLISIDSSTGIIKIEKGLAVGTYQVDIEATNTDGVQYFFDAYQVTINANLTTFDAFVKPIIQQKCASCHTSGSSAFTKYENSKLFIDAILDRVQRQTDEPGFMPDSRPPLSAEEINVIKKWNSDGLIQ
jgi:hypothetical protein